MYWICIPAVLDHDRPWRSDAALGSVGLLCTFNGEPLLRDVNNDLISLLPLKIGGRI